MSVEDSGPSAIRGWGCTPTGDPPPAAAVSTQDTRKRCPPRIFTAGWRRTALYGIIVFLMLLVFLNIGLTLWIIGALKLSVVRYFLPLPQTYRSSCRWSSFLLHPMNSELTHGKLQIYIKILYHKILLYTLLYEFGYIFCSYMRE